LPFLLLKFPKIGIAKQLKKYNMSRSDRKLSVSVLVLANISVSAEISVSAIFVSFLVLADISDCGSLIDFSIDFSIKFSIKI
jgi:hypothetical protein